MQCYLIRHAQTDVHRASRHLFGVAGAPINADGQQQARRLGDRLRELGIDTTREQVAVSELLRTQQTATAAGFQDLRVNTMLNEINTSDPNNTTRLVGLGRVPPEAIAAADALLANPPQQRIWVTHGLVIAALLLQLGASNPLHFVPDFCEITIIDV